MEAKRCSWPAVGRCNDPSSGRRTHVSASPPCPISHSQHTQYTGVGARLDGGIWSCWLTLGGTALSPPAGVALSKLCRSVWVSGRGVSGIRDKRYKRPTTDVAGYTNSWTYRLVFLCSLLNCGGGLHCAMHTARRQQNGRCRRCGMDVTRLLGCAYRERVMWANCGISR